MVEKIKKLWQDQGRVMLLVGVVFLMSAVMSCLMLTFMANQNLMRTGIMGAGGVEVSKEVQKIVKEWQGGVRGQVGLVIYDWENKVKVAEIDEGKKFPIGDLLDIPLVYEGMFRLSSKFNNASDKMVEDLTREQCLEEVLVRRNMSCRNKMMAEMGGGILTSTLRSRLELGATDIEQTTVSDMVKVLGFYLKGVGIDEIYQEKAGEVLRKNAVMSGLARGLKGAKVYGRSGGCVKMDGGSCAGWRDLVLVEIGQKRHYIVGVFLEQNDEGSLNELGRKLAGKLK